MNEEERQLERAHLFWSIVLSTVTFAVGYTLTSRMLLAIVTVIAGTFIWNGTLWTARLSRGYGTLSRVVRHVKQSMASDMEVRVKIYSGCYYIPNIFKQDMIGALIFPVFILALDFLLVERREFYGDVLAVILITVALYLSPKILFWIRYNLFFRLWRTSKRQFDQICDQFQVPLERRPCLWIELSEKGWVQE